MVVRLAEGRVMKKCEKKCSERSFNCKSRCGLSTEDPSASVLDIMKWPCECVEAITEMHIMLNY